MAQHTRRTSRMATNRAALSIFTAILLVVSTSQATRALYLDPIALEKACTVAVNQNMLTPVEASVLKAYSETLNENKVRFDFKDYAGVPQSSIGFNDYINRTEMLLGVAIANQYADELVEPQGQNSGSRRQLASEKKWTIGSVLGGKSPEEIRAIVEKGKNGELVRDALRSVLHYEATSEAGGNKPFIDYNVPVGKSLWYDVLPKMGATTDVERGWAMRYILNVTPADTFGSRNVAAAGKQKGPLMVRIPSQIRMPVGGGVSHLPHTYNYGAVHAMRSVANGVATLRLAFKK